MASNLASNTGGPQPISWPRGEEVDVAEVTGKGRLLLRRIVGQVVAVLSVAGSRIDRIAEHVERIGEKGVVMIKGINSRSGKV